MVSAICLSIDWHEKVSFLRQNNGVPIHAATVHIVIGWSAGHAAHLEHVDFCCPE